MLVSATFHQPQHVARSELGRMRQVERTGPMQPFHRSHDKRKECSNYSRPGSRGTSMYLDTFLHLHRPPTWTYYTSYPVPVYPPDDARSSIFLISASISVYLDILFLGVLFLHDDLLGEAHHVCLPICPSTGATRGTHGCLGPKEDAGIA